MGMGHIVGREDPLQAKLCVLGIYPEDFVATLDFYKPEGIDGLSISVETNIYSKKKRKIRTLLTNGTPTYVFFFRFFKL